MPFVSDSELRRLRIAEAKCRVFELERTRTRLALELRFRVVPKDEIPRQEVRLEEVRADLAVARLRLNEALRVADAPATLAPI